MSWAEMQKMGYAKIIVDTSTMTVGDKVRVKSVYNPTQYMDKQVATVGTPLIFDLGFMKDYLKICMVQTINDTPTEIGGVYKTVDYGQTIFIDVLDQRSLVVAKRIVNAHQHNAIYSVGDEVDVTIGGVKVTFQDAGHDLYASNEIVYVAKDGYQNINLHSNQTGSPMPYRDVTGRTTISGIYNSIEESDRQCISKLYKTSRPAVNSTSQSGFVGFEDYIWIPNYIEVFGVAGELQDTNCEKKQFPLFITQAERLKKFNGADTTWWLCDGIADQYGARRFHVVSISGTDSYQSPVNSFSVVPCFRIVADS